jgi:hypothetical protein
MRHIEFSAELVILLIEGPQDKKGAIDLYYGNYKDRFDQAKQVKDLLLFYFEWIFKALPDFERRFIRKPVDLYGLIGAIKLLTDGTKNVSKIDPRKFYSSITSFEKALKGDEKQGDIAKYIVASSRQTDNLTPRLTRIEIISKVLLGKI